MKNDTKLAVKYFPKYKKRELRYSRFSEILEVFWYSNGHFVTNQLYMSYAYKSYKKGFMQNIEIWSF